MEETVTFWLDNKISSGFKVAEIGNQMLVCYRDKYYLVEGGAAKMKGVRPLHYSKSSLPTVWKKAMRGILPTPAEPAPQQEEESLPITTTVKKERPKMEKSTLPKAEALENQELEIKKTAPPASNAEMKPLKTVKKPEPRPLPQNLVVANCPYCNCKHELSLDKGKNGRPFFVACSKCSLEFAVKFVPVTVYQAQVAAFK